MRGPGRSMAPSPPRRHAIEEAQYACMIHIASERLILRNWQATDLEAWAAIDANPEVRLHLGGGMPVDRKDALHMMAAAAGNQILNGFGMWAAEEKATGQLIGRIGSLRAAPFPRSRGQLASRTHVVGQASCLRGSRSLHRARLRPPRSADGFCLHRRWQRTFNAPCATPGHGGHRRALARRAPISAPPRNLMQQPSRFELRALYAARPSSSAAPSCPCSALKN